MKFRKWLAATLSLCMLLPTVALAADVAQDEIVILGSGYIENPYGPHGVTEPAVIADGGEARITLPNVYYDNADAAAEALLTGMKDRENEVVIGVTEELYATLGGDDAWYNLFDAAIAHNISDPKSGDYIGFLFDQTGGTYGRTAGKAEYFLQYSLYYRTTLEQENAVDEKVDELVTTWKSQNLNEFETIQTIYDYITANVNYDYEGLFDDTDLTKYTAYGALCENSAVCMGISILFYRLALEMGIDARYINSIKSENHAWNIAALGDLYYNFDATWDLSENDGSGYEWFMKNMADFQVNYDGSACHTRAEVYLTDEWMTAYPMADVSYWVGGGNTVEEDRGNISFQVPRIDVDTTNWTPDCLWEEGEYTEIDVKRTWISTSCNDNNNTIIAKNLPLRLGMSWDDEYIYTYVEFTDPNGHDNTWGDNPSSMWCSGCMQVGYAEANATSTDRLEYGIARTSDTNELISNVWAEKNYNPSTNDFNIQVGENDTMVYEFRTPVAGFSNVPAAMGATYGVCYVLSWGNDYDYAHTQLGYGITDFRKAAEDFMKITLVEEALEEGTWYTWENLEWAYDAGTLTIRGEGEIPEQTNNYPWLVFHNDIKHVVIEEGITVIPYGMLEVLSGLETLSLPSTLVSLSVQELSYLSNLETITIDANNPKYFMQDGALFSNENGYCTLENYLRGNTAMSYSVPDTVDCISTYAFSNHEYLEEVFIPASVTKIWGGAFRFSFALNTIRVAEDNPNYVSVDDILYTKDKKELLVYPYSYGATTFTVPDAVTKMTADVFQTEYMEKLTISKNVSVIEGMTHAISDYALQEIVVVEENPNYCSVDGVLYSKDMTTLYWYPARKSDTVYHIPDTVTTINTFSLFNTQNIQTLYMGAAVETIDYLLLVEDTAVNVIYFPGDLPDYFAEAFWNLADCVTMYYPNGASGWSTPTTTVDGVAYRTAPYYTNEDDIPWNTWYNIQWYYDVATKTLTIRGAGEIPSISWNENYPWDTYKDELEHVMIKEGITEIRSSMIYGYYEMATFSIPATVSKIVFDDLVFGTCDLQSITVDANNPNFVSVDGVLYSKDMTVLYVYPSASPMTTYTVPDTVEEMTYSIFTSARQLKTLYIPASVKTIWDVHSMSNMCAIEEIHVAADNPNYCSVDGVLYSKDMTTLYQYPNRKADAVYIIPDTVETISWYSLFHTQYLETVYMGENVKNVGGNLFYYYHDYANDINLTSVYFPGDLPGYFADAFDNIADLATFYYPTGAAGWTTPTTTVNGITYKTAPYNTTTAEDLTGDGTVNADDLALLTDYFSGKSNIDFDPTKADFNHDGTFARADVMYLARALAGWDGYTLD